MLASFLSSSTALAAARTEQDFQDENFLRKIPLNFFKSLMESNGCDPTYDDYETCENLVPTNFLQKYSRTLVDKMWKLSIKTLCFLFCGI